MCLLSMLLARLVPVFSLGWVAGHLLTYPDWIASSSAGAGLGRKMRTRCPVFPLLVVLNTTHWLPTDRASPLVFCSVLRRGHLGSNVNRSTASVCWTSSASQGLNRLKGAGMARFKAPGS